MASFSAALGAEMLEQPFRIVFQAGNDLAAIEARCALPDLAGIQHLNAETEARGMQGGRQAHEATADNGDIDRLAVRDERLECGCGFRLLPDRNGTRCGQGFT